MFEDDVLLLQFCILDVLVVYFCNFLAFWVL